MGRRASRFRYTQSEAPFPNELLHDIFFEVSPQEDERGVFILQPQNLQDLQTCPIGHPAGSQDHVILLRPQPRGKCFRGLHHVRGDRELHSLELLQPRFYISQMIVGDQEPYDSPPVGGGAAGCQRLDGLDAFHSVGAGA